MNRVYTPCLENVPEYFDHAVHVTIKGISNILTSLEPHSMIFSVKYLAGVPGYVYTENERYEFQKKLRDTLKGLSEDRGMLMYNTSRSVLCLSYLNFILYIIAHIVS